MKLLSEHENAFIPIEKLRDYVLNAHHPEGKHKAKVFASLLGVTHFDAEWLKDQIIVALRVNFAIEQEPSPFGKRYAVDMLISNGEKRLF